MNLEFKTLAFEIKAKGGDSPDIAATFEGLGAVYNNLDWKGDIIAPGAFTQDLPGFKSEGKVRDEHGITTGRVMDASDSAEGLHVKGMILPTTNGTNQAILLKGGAVKDLSIGYRAIGKSWLNSPDEVKAYWQTKGYTPTDDDLIALGAYGGARLLTRVKPYEVSTTWMPANSKSQITSVKSGVTRASRTFSDHSDQALATVGEYLERAEDLAAKRSESGRSLSVETKSRLTQLQGRLAKLLASLETKAAETPAESQATDIHSLYAETLATFARLDGHLA